MSILIKGMSMPNDGVEWIMFLRVTSGEVELFDPIGEDESVFYKAVELPPHGRLGDLDELVKYKDKLVVDADKLDLKFRFVVDTKYIDEAPTIISASEEE